MVVQLQEPRVVFRFRDSCNCCWWSRPLRDCDPVYITATGEVKKFDYSKGSAEDNARRVFQNMQARIDEIAANQMQTQAILHQIQEQMAIDFQAPRILNRSQVERIEEITLGVLRAPSPPASEKPVPPNTPKPLTKSPAMRDIRVDQEEVYAHSVYELERSSD